VYRIEKLLVPWGIHIMNSHSFRSSGPQGRNQLLRACTWLCLVMACVASMLAPRAAEASTIRWKAAVNGSWHDETKWDLNRTPIAGDDVFITISNGTSSYAVSTDTAISINSLTLGNNSTGGPTQTLNNFGINFTIANASTINRSGRLNSNGNLFGAGKLTIFGAYNWRGGNLSGSGQILVQPDGLIEIGQAAATFAPTIGLHRLVQNYGTVRVLPSSSLTTITVFGANSSTFLNYGLFEFQGDALFQWNNENAPPTFYNIGTVRKTVSTGRTEFEDMRFDTAGGCIVDVQTGNLRLRGGGKTQTPGATGTTVQFKVLPDALLEFYGDYTFDLKTTLGGGGRVTANNGNLNNTAEVVAEDFDLNGGVITGSGVFRVTASMAWVGGGMSGTGTTVMNPGSFCAFLNEGNKTLSRTMLNAGSAVWFSSSTLTMNPGAVFNNMPSGTFDVLANANINAAVGATPQFNNYGIFRQPDTGAGALTNPAISAKAQKLLAATKNLRLLNAPRAGEIVKFSKVKVFNQGLIEWRSGNLDLGPSFIQTGGQTSLLGGNISATDVSTTGTAPTFIRYNMNYTGGILDGIGQVNANVINSGGKIKPGQSPGTIEIVGNYTQTAGGALDMEIAGTVPGTQFDRLVVGGSAQLAGALNLFRLDGFVPLVGTSFELIETAAGLSGAFGTINGSAVGAGKVLTPSYGESIFAVGTTLDAALPTVSVLTPIAGGIYPGGGLPVLSSTTGISADLASGIIGVTVALGQFATADAPSPTAYWNWTTNAFTSPFNAAVHEKAAIGTLAWSLATPVLPGGQYGIRATATDGADNKGVTAFTRFSVPSSSFTISGKIKNSNGEGMPSLQIGRTGGVVVMTDVNGNYSFPNVVPGAYTLTPVIPAVLTGSTFTPGTRQATVTTANLINQDFTVTFTVKGTVRNSLGAGMSGIQVKRTFNAVTTVQITDADGNFTFTNVPSGAHVIAPNPTAATTGFTFSPATYNLVVSKSNVSNQNFTVWFSVSGSVRNSLGVGVPNLLIKRTQGNSVISVPTAADGTFRFPDVRSGVYTLAPNITPAMAGLSFSPATLSPNVVKNNLTNQNFTVWYTISGKVTNSSNVPQANVLITRTQGVSSTSVPTLADGTYSFKDTRSGTYTVSGPGLSPASRSVVVGTANMPNINFVK